MIGRRRAFTLIEVMVAVAILAFAATAAIKLVVLGQKGLAEARSSIALTNEARSIRIGILTGEIRSSGELGDTTWETSVGKEKMFGEDFGRPDISASKDASTVSIKTAIGWRELKVTNKKTEGSITLYLPRD